MHTTGFAHNERTSHGERNAANENGRGPNGRRRRRDGQRARRFLEHVSGDRLYPLWRLQRRRVCVGATARADLALPRLDGARLVVEQQLVPDQGRLHLRPAEVGGRGGLSRSTRNGAHPAGDHREAQLLERAFAAPAYVDRGPRVRRRARRRDPPTPAHGGFGSHRKGGQHSRRERCTSCGTPRPRWRSRRACLSTSSRRGWATIRTQFSTPTRTCSRSRTSWQPSGWRAARRLASRWHRAANLTGRGETYTGMI